MKLKEQVFTSEGALIQTIDDVSPWYVNKQHLGVDFCVHWYNLFKLL